MAIGYVGDNSYFQLGRKRVYWKQDFAERVLSSASYGYGGDGYIYLVQQAQSFISYTGLNTSTLTLVQANGSTINRNAQQGGTWQAMTYNGVPSTPVPFDYYTPA